MKTIKFVLLLALVLQVLATSVRAQMRPTLFIIGDSSVKTPTEGQQGWVGLNAESVETGVKELKKCNLTKYLAKESRG
jgi:hypothetical protein